MAVRQYYRIRRDLIKTVQIDNLKGLLCIRRMDRIPNTWISKFCSVVRHVERMEKNMTAKREYLRACVVAQWVAHGRDGLIS